MPVIQLEIDSSGAITSLQKFDRAVDKTESNTVPKFNTMAKVVSAFVVATGVAAIAISKVAIDAAASMEEAQSKYNVVFDGMTDTTESWVNELRNNYALSELAAKDYLSSTKAIIDGTNMQSRAAAELSNKVVLLAQDMASFHDKAPEQAVNAMTSALTGEYEAMKQFGVVIKKSMVNIEAKRIADLEGAEAVTQAHEAQAAYNLIVQKSGETMGDTIRSQETYTFQMKKFWSIIEDVKVVIGDELLPAVTKVITKFNDWYKANQAIIEADIKGWIKLTADAFTALAETVGWLYDTYMDFLMAQGLLSQEQVNARVANELLADSVLADAAAREKQKKSVEDVTKANMENSEAQQTSNEMVSDSPSLQNTAQISADKLTESIKRQAEAARVAASALSAWNSAADKEAAASGVGVSFGGDDGTARWTDQGWQTQAEQTASGSTVINNFNQNVSRSDIENITETQTSQEARL